VARRRTRRGEIESRPSSRCDLVALTHRHGLAIVLVDVEKVIDRARLVRLATKAITPMKLEHSKYAGAAHTSHSRCCARISAMRFSTFSYDPKCRIRSMIGASSISSTI
jgi:hypothetical protein